MIEKIRRITNPLTVIAIFAGLAEVAGTVAIGLVEKDLQSIFIWYVMTFPILLVVAFFITLNFNQKVLYAPSDFRKDETFLSLFPELQIPTSILDSSTDSQKEKPDERFQLTLIDHLSPESRKYLLLVLDKALTMYEHRDIIGQIAVPKGMSNSPEDAKYIQAYSIGFLASFFGNNLGSLFTFENIGGDNRITLRMSAKLVEALNTRENAIKK